MRKVVAIGVVTFIVIVTILIAMLLSGRLAVFIALMPSSINDDFESGVESISLDLSRFHNRIVAYQMRNRPFGRTVGRIYDAETALQRARELWAFYGADSDPHRFDLFVSYDYDKDIWVVSADIRNPEPTSDYYIVIPSIGGREALIRRNGRVLAVWFIS